MYKKIKHNLYEFKIQDTVISVEILKDGIEIYEKNNPAKTGFIFEDKKDIIPLINNLTDIAEEVL